MHLQQDAVSGKYLFGDEAQQQLKAGTGEVRWEKMSKSKGNGVEPSRIIREVGVDATRLNVLFKVRMQKRGVAHLSVDHASLPRLPNPA